MRERSTIAKLIAVLMALVLVAAACGGDDDGGDDATAGNEGEGGEGEAGGELVDLGTFSSQPPQHIDPALNSELDSYQVVNALYDGLTDLDFSDPENPEVKGLVAETFEPNEDATEWVFTIKEGLTFSNGEEVLPSSFVRAWERATDMDGVYNYLFGTFIEGGQEKLDGEAETISGVTADDEAMTLTVRLVAPYANFDAVAGFQIFFPMPSDVEELDDQNEWENGLMIGNGPYKLAEPRNDQQIVVERNDEWGGDIFGNDRATLDQITFRISQDIESAYNEFEAGEGDNATVPPGRVVEADETYDSTIDLNLLATNYFEINQEDPVVGGPDNKLLRQAMSLAIDRDEINEVVYDGTRTNATGVTPPGIPGYEAEGQCDYCERDTEAAQDAFDQWESEGGSLDGPIRIQHDRSDTRQSDIVQIIIDNWAEVGIEAEPEPLDGETYFDQLSEGACQVCASGWIADYPTYDNFMNDLFFSDSGNNHGRYNNPEFERLVNEAKATTDDDEAGELYRQAEQILLNEDVGALPLNYQNGDYVFNPDTVPDFTQRPDAIISYETITVSG